MAECRRRDWGTTLGAAGVGGVGAEVVGAGGAEAETGGAAGEPAAAKRRAATY